MMATGGGDPAQMQQQMAIAAQRQRIFALAQQISPQDVQRIRQQQGQKVANMTDDALRQQIAMIRLQQRSNLQQQTLEQQQTSQQQKILQQQTPEQSMMPQPEDIDPTISQDHTAGREECERALLSIAGSTVVKSDYASKSNAEATAVEGLRHEQENLSSQAQKQLQHQWMKGNVLNILKPAGGNLGGPQEGGMSRSFAQLTSLGERPLKKRKIQQALVNDGSTWRENRLEDPSSFANQPGKYDTIRNSDVIEGPDTQPTHPESSQHHPENTTLNQIHCYTIGSTETSSALGTEQPTVDRSSEISPVLNEKPINIRLQKESASVDAKRHWCEDSAPQHELQLLHLEIVRLRNENSRLEKLVCRTSKQIFAPLPSSRIFLHRLDDKLYFDAPHWTRDQDDWYMECRKAVSNPGIFLERQKHNGVAFAVFSEYENNPSSSYHPDFENLYYGTGNRGPIQPTHTSIHFLCKVLDNAWRNLLEQDETMERLCHFSCDSEESCEVLTHELRSVHDVETFFYHFQPQILEHIDCMVHCKEKQQLNLLVDFVMDSFQAEYDSARRLFDNGLVTEDYAKYLFAPGAILISREGQNDMGFVQKSFARKVQEQTSTVDDASEKQGLMMHAAAQKQTLMVHAVSWVFDDDGTFKTKDKNLSTHFKSINDQIQISSLDFYPLQYADVQIAERLRARGHTFWRCRESAYVSYTGLDINQETEYVDTRFLIDVRTYCTMHPSGRTTHSQIPHDDHMDEETMACDEPPDDGTFVYLVPPSIYGFELQEKKWVNLQVDNIHPLEWNKDAFESLAIDKESKELIDALVNNKIAAEKSTDMVKGKGNGLIILLHGGPGTGKTLTAESVAEMAEKPLYRVTCGDIGTEPREVEKYLQKVFHLGKIWDCVVLLDEADVFLEQRTLADLSRNALVSVFLRTLEYYDGILILTSNRVGTFDEAFKSRIQLALHYEKLTFSQRMQIWQNFIHRLDTLEEDVDVESILAGIKKLAKHEMNGRQIRNAITTARQLALFKKETLGVKHLEHSIQVSGKFDKYLDEVHDQIKDDEMARQEGRR